MSDPARAMCSSAGQMVWSKDKDGISHYGICYAPSAIGAQIGPTSIGEKCVENSYFVLETNQYCCKNPRIYIKGQRFSAHHPVCGDTMAEFDSETQKIRVTNTASTSGTAAQVNAVTGAGLGNLDFSPLTLLTKKNEWKEVGKVTCVGQAGMLVKMIGTDRAEMCAPGTPPIRGPGYQSWMCDGTYIKPHRYHCCKLQDGTVHCVPKFSDQTARAACMCTGALAPDEAPDLHAASSAAGEATVAHASLDLVAATFAALAPPRAAARRRCSRRQGRSFL